MTFSLVARDDATGAFGIVICSSSPAVAARCAHARANVGVVASQNITNPALGPRVLDSLAGGSDADTALKAALAQEQFPDYRQLTVVDIHGNTAVHSGSTQPWACTPTPRVIRRWRRATSSKAKR